MVKKMLTISVLLAMVVSLSGCWSCGSYHEMKGTGPVEPAGEHKFFWDKECKPIGSVPAKPAKEEKPAKPADKVYSGCENQYSAVQIEKMMPAQVQVNAPFEYKIKARNNSCGDVHDVIVTETLGDVFKFESASPEASKSGKELTWNLGTIEAEQYKVITIKGQATSANTVESCAVVTYLQPACASVAVVEPMLEITHTAPNKVVVCDEIPLVITVKNNGTGAANNVVITSKLPEGLLTVDGKKEVKVDVGTLAAGESQQFAVSTIASETGSYKSVAAATATGLEAQSAELATLVTQPILEITKTGDDTIYLGRGVEYTIEVTNTGDEDAVDTVVKDIIPAGVTNIVATQGGEVSGNVAVWALGTLAPNASKTVKIQYLPETAGNYSNEATVSAVCADAVVAAASTEIRGIPALLLEVIDIEDPIAVGNNETYVITVTNQGTSTATNITIKAFLEDTMQFVSATGATAGSLAGETITFTALPRLAPGQEATWNVVVKAIKSGDVRFGVAMNSDQLGRDVEETEATYFYE